jgi:hypothetical protein
MTHSDETLELDAEGYPHLPDDVLGLRLSRKKAVIRQFVAAVRHMYDSCLWKRQLIHFF